MLPIDANLDRKGDSMDDDKHPEIKHDLEDYQVCKLTIATVRCYPTHRIWLHILCNLINIIFIPTDVQRIILTSIES